MGICPLDGAQAGVKESMERVNDWLSSSSIGLIQRNPGKCYMERWMRVLSKSKRNGRIRLQVNPGVYYTGARVPQLTWIVNRSGTSPSATWLTSKGTLKEYLRDSPSETSFLPLSFSLYSNFSLLSSPFSLHLRPPLNT